LTAISTLPLNNGQAVLEIAFQCNRVNCQRMMIARYWCVTPGAFGLREVVPSTSKPIDLPESIRAISPTFAATYSQALAAETYQLTQIVGIGLRRALEFLIKDYCVSIDGSSRDEIERKWLSDCIKERIDDRRVKSCAERAVWLGNDEAHYRRLWTDFDVNDLKTLIRLTMNFIENDLLSKEYEASMQRRSKPEGGA
jgi:hypothetical protein